MKAVILASGAGKRLRPFTDCVPKPLIRIGNKTILDYQLEGLIKHGIETLFVGALTFEIGFFQFVGSYSFSYQ